MPPRPPSKQRTKDPLAGMPEDTKAAIQKILGDYSPRANASGGSDIARHLADKDPADIEKLMAALSSMDIPEPDLDKFDYSTVPVKNKSFWVMQLTPDGFVTRDGQFVQQYTPGCQPNFQLIVYDERSSFRVSATPPQPGMPSSAFILTSFKRAIACPLPPLRQSLPSQLIIALKLSPHIDTLRPFLNSLPAPFEWRLETPEEAQEVAEGVYDRNKEGVLTGLSTAESEKTLGNQAVARKDRLKAVRHYTEAIECLQDARAQSPTEDELKKIKSLVSVCYANRAAAWLMEGTGQDPKKALEDAECAVRFDETYGKA
ncbi:hypothetical protein PHLCEN_2v8874 [Hermanssonia centrifuga]|uniref:Uncharacterized protein n=1 Tax=Hermanssonia centrifuga TaxID=98765 RepID=A0A2R6NSA7_9APHY|nr:hypothetical protein PHLCEN_2v8874 [Hermanssonia centrifuga]